MSERILEKNGVDNTNIDGAGFNRFCAGNKDGIIRGILNECAATIQGNTFTLSTGELIICGFRIVIESPIVRTFTTIPVTPTIYQLIGEIQVSSSSEVQFAWRFQTVQQLTQDNLFNTLSGQGTYQAEICRFIQGSDGSLGALVTTMNVISGGAGTKGSITIGNVTTNTLPAGSQASVDVDEREEDGVVYTDFIFWIPQGADGKDGAQGATGLEALTFNRIEPSVFIKGSQKVFDKSDFNRVPIKGEVFIAYSAQNMYALMNVDAVGETTNVYVTPKAVVNTQGANGKDGKSFQSLSEFSIGVLDWVTLSNKSPYTVRATKTITLTESIDENSDVMVSFDDVVVSTGVIVANVTGTLSLTIEFYAVKTPKSTVTGTIGGVK